MKKKIAQSIMLLEMNGYTVTAPQKPTESEYKKAIRTGKKPAIWPPIMMTREDLMHFRETHGL